MTHASFSSHLHTPQQDVERLWQAPTATGKLSAIVTIPGSKSLSNRYLILAALSKTPTVLKGLLISRDTELMMEALKTLGVGIDRSDSASTTVRVTPPVSGRFTGNTSVFCGLAGTVMRFVPGLALFADGPVHFSGDIQAGERPMKPILDGLEQLGAQVEYEGEIGRLPFTITPPVKSSYTNKNNDHTAHTVDAVEEQNREAIVSIDSSASSQFISGLLLIGSRVQGGLIVRHTGKKVPSMPHIAMTMDDVAAAGGAISNPVKGEWLVKQHPLDMPHTMVIEPDLSNSAPFLEAALLAGGSVSVPNWPQKTTQPGALLPGILEKFGASVSLSNDDLGRRVLTVTSDGTVISPGNLDLSEAGELAPSIAALTVFANGVTRLHGIAHLRGHETNRLAALVTEINRFGGQAKELEDGISVTPVPVSQLHAATVETYADHRMATFAAMIGLRVEGIRVVDIATTRKTLPDFVSMWTQMLSQRA